ncbi:MAG: LysR family transcriptional regulator [Burkholderiales bacterium]|nr:LysR family transcriptional regulator [Bacteroidia bacterium]
MNLQQLEYIIAVDKLKNFVKASESCFVTQATLSMMIKKLEEELDAKIFDRSKQPVKTTEIGVKIITQARKIILESKKLKEIISEEKGIVSGELRLGIIPTLAPYLLPLFLKKFTQDFPLIKLIINEYTTDIITHKLKTGELDAGILSTPLNDSAIKEQVLFNERYFLYVNSKEKGFNKQYVLPKDIDINRLWLLEEGHCMRSQILNLCALKKQKELGERFLYNAGSIETLKNMVDTNFGMTIIPELAIRNFNPSQKKRLRIFKSPAPVREISLVIHREFLKANLIQSLKETILSVIPNDMKQNKHINIVEM